jgi:hypothetical protein
MDTTEILVLIGLLIANLALLSLSNVIFIKSCALQEVKG